MANKKADTKQKPNPRWFTHQQLAKRLGKTVTSLRQWGVEPVAKIPPNVFYDLNDVIQNRIENYVAKHQKPAEQSTEAELHRAEREEKLLLTKAQREGQELKNAQLRKELAPVAVIEWTLGKVGSQIAALLDSLPLQIKKRCPKLTASGIEVIQREIVKAQNIAAQVTVDYAEFQRNTE